MGEHGGECEMGRWETHWTRKDGELRDLGGGRWALRGRMEEGLGMGVGVGGSVGVLAGVGREARVTWTRAGVQVTHPSHLTAHVEQAQYDLQEKKINTSEIQFSSLSDIANNQKT